MRLESNVSLATRLKNDILHIGHMLLLHICYHSRTNISVTIIIQCGNRDRHIKPDIDIGTLISIHTIQILVLTRLHKHDTFISQKYRPPVKSSVKIEKKNPLEVLKAAGYSELDHCGASIIAFLSLRLCNFEAEYVLVLKKKPMRTMY